MSEDAYPICRACPKCGARYAKKTRSSRLFTISGDRRCTRCATHYTPPTPRWVAYLFLACGGLLMVKSAFGLIAVLTESGAPTPDADEHGLGGFVCLGLVTLFGLLSLWQGVRVWREKQVEPPTYDPGEGV